MLLIISSIFFVAVSIILVVLILVQNDKGGGLSATMGGGLSNANSVMGAQNTENILNKGTIIFAVLDFVLTIVISLGISRFESKKDGNSQIKKSLQTEQTPASQPVN